ncbi:Uncharacterized protein GBIM_00223 [Gryllus bimaculatus]|nr:Uncharacterized protein GBIM_00223 [Gryllus bimaculatus]
MIVYLLQQNCGTSEKGSFAGADERQVVARGEPGAAAVLRERLLKRLEDLWDDVRDPRWVAMADETAGADAELLRAVYALGDAVENEVPGSAAAPPHGLDSLWVWARTEAEIVALETLYKTFRRTYRPGRLPGSRQTYQDLADALLAGVPGVFDRLEDIVLHDGEGDLFRQALKELESLQCAVQQSPQQVIYNLYNAVALSELKGYAMMQFSWMLLRLYNKGNFTQEATLLRDSFEERTRRQVEAVRAAMGSASRALWRCDPRVHQEGDTFVQLTRLVQGHVQNEADMNREKSCRENCAYYSYAQSTGCYDSRVCDTMHRCNGRLLECKYIDSDMWLCQAERQATRRYEWLEYENGRTLGRPGTCARRKFKVDSWWRWLFWHCSYCFCLCDEPGPRSDRYFNMRPVVADTANNMVVTGLRFVKKNRVIHLQIREGALLPRGAINASSVRWRPVDDYHITDAGVQNTRDYHTLSWEQRAIDLDDLEAPPGHVVTGVRFRNVGTHLNPEIMVAPLNFSAGTLVKPHEKSMWMSNDNTDGAMIGPRTELKLLAPDVPTNSLAGSTPDSKSDQFLLFTHSDMDADAAQTTVPFLDAQEVAPEPPVPLAGAGIYHKGTPRYGGFVAPRVFTYDFSPHLVDDAPAHAAPPAA